MSHLNARLTPQARPGLVLEVAGGWTRAEAARRFHVSRATAAKRLRRYREEGEAGLRDRCSRPRRSAAPHGSAVASGVLRLRQELGWGPHRIAWDLGMAPSTAYAVLRHAGLHRRDRMRRVSREVVRYERDRPGELLHLDVKKLGRIPPGGGKRFAPGFAETGSGPRGKGGGGLDYVHVAVDDRSRYAYAEALPDERGPTTAAFLERAIARFAGLGVRVERVLTDNGGNYPAGPSARRRRRAEWGCGGRGRTGRRPTASPRPPSRSCRPSRRTGGATPRTGSGSTPSRSSSGSTTATVRTAASAGPSPPPACKQRLWELQLRAQQGRASWGAPAPRSLGASRRAAASGSPGLRRDRRRPRLRARRDRRPLALRLRRGAAGRARPGVRRGRAAEPACQRDRDRREYEQPHGGEEDVTEEVLGHARHESEHRDAQSVEDV